MTVDALFRHGIRAGLTPQEVRRTRVRDLLLCIQATEQDERADWRRTLAIVNSIPLVEETVTLEDVYGATSRGHDTAEYEAFKGRTQGWAQKYVTDFDAPEM